MMDNSTEQFTLKVDIAKNDMISECILTIAVVKDDDYFAWTNMTLDYVLSSTLPDMASNASCRFVIQIKMSFSTFSD